MIGAVSFNLPIDKVNGHDCTNEKSLETKWINRASKSRVCGAINRWLLLFRLAHIPLQRIASNWCGSHPASGLLISYSLDQGPNSCFGKIRGGSKLSLAFTGNICLSSIVNDRKNVPTLGIEMSNKEPQPYRQEQKRAKSLWWSHRFVTTVSAKASKQRK